jgi:hypothetical protein
MGKGGGGGGGPSQQTVTQTNLPEYARPYFENLLERGQAESYREYTPYGGERIAGFDPMQTAAQQQVAGMQTPGQFGSGTNLATTGGQQSLGYGGAGAAMGSGAVGTGQQALGYGGAGAAYGAYGAGLGGLASGAGQNYFDMATNPYAQAAFMSPYMQNVIDAQKREAITDAQKAQLNANLGAARQGTYGGARQLLAGTERERALGQQLGDIQDKGMQSAYDQAMKAMQFGSDIGLRGYQTGIQGAQTGIEGARTGMQGVGQALQGYQTGLQGLGLGLQGAQQATQAGQTLGQLGTSQQAADLQRIQALSAAGAEQRGYDQQLMDTAYADFLRQRDYPMEQLGYYSNLLRGLPMQMGSTQTTYAQPPSTTSQIAGLGLAGLSLSNLLK